MNKPKMIEAFSEDEWRRFRQRGFRWHVTDTGTVVVTAPTNAVGSGRTVFQAAHQFRAMFT